MTPLKQLAEHDQSVWIDFLSRRFVKDGDLKGLVEQGVVGVTSNPTIFQGAIAEGDAYDEQIRELSAEHEDPKEIFWQLAKDDIRDACDILRSVYDEGEGKDGWVSLEVDPNLAHDTAKTKSEAIRLHELVDRPNLFIKIPATVEGLQAIEDTIAAGIPVNVTLIFSLERHRAVAEAYVRGVQRFVDGGGDPRGKLASVASFFVSRVDTEADKRLDEIGGHDELKGKLAIANAKLAYRDLPGGLLLAGVGGAGGQGRDQAALPVGLDRRPRTRPTRTRSTSRSSSGPTPSTRCRASSSRRSPTTARSAATRCSRTSTRRAASSTPSRPPASSTTTSSQTLEREGVEKFSKSFAELIEGLEKKLKLVAA